MSFHNLEVVVWSGFRGSGCGRLPDTLEFHLLHPLILTWYQSCYFSSLSPSRRARNRELSRIRNQNGRRVYCCTYRIPQTITQPPRAVFKAWFLDKGGRTEYAGAEISGCAENHTNSAACLYTWPAAVTVNDNISLPFASRYRVPVSASEAVEPEGRTRTNDHRHRPLQHLLLFEILCLHRQHTAHSSQHTGHLPANFVSPCHPRRLPFPSASPPVGGARYCP